MAGSSKKILMLVFMFACCVSILVASLTGFFIYDDGTAGITSTDDGSGGSSGKLTINVEVSGTVLPNGVDCWYTGNSLSENGLIWKDKSGKGNDIKGDNIKGSLKTAVDPVTGKYVYGGIEDGITIPFDFTGTAWTILTVARYNGDNKERIFDGVDANWLAGWHGGGTGIAHYGNKGWVTPTTDVHGTGRTWIQTSAYKTQFYSNGVVRSGEKYVGEAPGKIAINMGKYAASESSDWAVHEIIVYGRALSAKHRKQVEKYLMDTYLSPELQSGIDFTKGYVADKPFVGKMNLGGTAEKCRLYAEKLGYKIWAHRTEKHVKSLKNVCFFYPNTEGISYEGDTSDDTNVIGCTEKHAKLKDGCIKKIN